MAPCPYLYGQDDAYDVRFAHQDGSGYAEESDQYVLVGHRPRCRHCAPNGCTCAPAYVPPAVPGQAAEAPPETPPTEPGVTPEGVPLAPGQFAAGDVGTFVSAPQGGIAQLAPNMIGDFFGGGGGQSAIFLFRNGPEAVIVPIPSPSTSAVGRVKMAENSSPLPRDRVFFNYSYFDNVPLTADGVNVNRYVPGFENTFLDGTMSVEMRFPFASTLSSDIIADGVTNDSRGEFGNLSAIWKTLLHVDRRWVATAGLQVTVPTADDVTVSLADGTELVHIDNQAVHLMPFAGLLWLPSDRLFVQSFYQVDVATNGNRVFLNDFQTGLTEAGKINDTTFMYADLGIGYWVYENRGAALTGIAPTFEVHYNESFQSADVIATGPYRIGDFADNVSILNAVFGTTFWFGANTSLTAGYATPIGGGNDQDFDGELRVIFNRFFGGMSRAGRAQF